MIERPAVAPPEPTASPADRGAAVVAALLIVVAVAALWATLEFTRLGAIFPRAIGAALLVAGAVALWRALRGQGPRSRGLPRDGWLRGLLMALVMALWIGLLERVGFVVAGISAFVALAVITEREPVTWRRLLRFALIAIAVVAAFQLLFVQGLKVQLPTGSFFVTR